MPPTYSLELAELCLPDANAQPVIDGAGTAFVPRQLESWRIFSRPSGGGDTGCVWVGNESSHGNLYWDLFPRKNQPRSTHFFLKRFWFMYALGVFYPSEIPDYSIV